MRVVRVVFEEEIKMFGLSEEEVREIAGKVVKTNGEEWDVSDVRVEDGFAIITVEVNGRFGGRLESWANLLQNKAIEIFEQIKQAVEDYAYFKQFFTVYNNCNGHNGRKSEDAREIMRKVGIPVIS